MAKYTVYLVRHGRTWFNKYDKMQGWSDSPLIPEGVKVAKVAAQNLKDTKFDAAFSSDARRAIDTVKIILDANTKSNITPEKLPEFREQFYGYFEGMNSPEAWFMAGQPHDAKTFKDIINKFNLDASKDFMKEADPFNDAENAAEYWDRINKGFAKLDKIAKDGDKILLVSHGTTIRSITEKFGNDKFDITVSPKNASLTVLERADGENTVTSYNKVLD